MVTDVMADVDVMAHAIAARVGRTGGDGQRRGGRDQTDERMSESPRKATLYAQHRLPWSVARLTAPCAGRPHAFGLALRLGVKKAALRPPCAYRACLDAALPEQHSQSA